MRDATRSAHIDANVILRLLLGEPADQAEAAKDLFDRAAAGELTLLVHPAVIAEVIYVLTSPRIAALPRRRVTDALRGLFALGGVEVADLNTVLAALARFETGSLDWVDALLLAYAPQIPVYTFDQAIVAAGGLSPAAPA